MFENSSLSIARPLEVLKRRRKTATAIARISGSVETSQTGLESRNKHSAATTASFCLKDLLAIEASLNISKVYKEALKHLNRSMYHTSYYPKPSLQLINNSRMATIPFQSNTVFDIQFLQLKVSVFSEWNSTREVVDYLPRIRIYFWKSEAFLSVKIK